MLAPVSFAWCGVQQRRSLAKHNHPPCVKHKCVHRAPRRLMLPHKTSWSRIDLNRFGRLRKKRPFKSYSVMSTPDPSDSCHSINRNLVLGLTQYSHDASVVVLDAATGDVLFALSKERLTRRKHDGGSVAATVRHALREVAKLDDVPFDEAAWYNSVCLVVANNHHFRILPFENGLPFSTAAGYNPPVYSSPWNLIGAHSTKTELSHHLAHAYSAVRHAPFDSGLILIMDGMGDSRNDWLRSQESYYDGVSGSNARAEGQGTKPYYTDFSIPKHPQFREFPIFDQNESCNAHSGTSFREAESAYIFEKNGNDIRLSRLFKRWTPEISPPELYNHGFQDMQSVGAIYSRCATHSFGDWNACGKVMGLAPWNDIRPVNDGLSDHPWECITTGRLFDGSFRVNSKFLAGLPFVNEWGRIDDTAIRSPCERRRFYEQLASRIQQDLERSALALLADVKGASNAKNLIFAGGVALNSSLNGRIIRESNFDDVYIPPHPGDEGIAMGCAVFGQLNLNRLVHDPLVHRDFQRGNVAPNTIVAGGNLRAPSCAKTEPTSYLPYLGTPCDTTQVQSIVSKYRPWVIVEEFDSLNALLKASAEALNKSEVVAWVNGRSEFGPRALGNRSLLADPRNVDMVQRLNAVVKRRESFRPFAPVCLEEHMGTMFQDCYRSTSSPFMSATFPLKHPEALAAVAHVDGSARVQILKPCDNDMLRDLILAFYDLTGIPVLLNTSFNVAGEPIVDSCDDALRTFLDSAGIDLLVFPSAQMIVRRRTVMSTEQDGNMISAVAGYGLRSSLTRNSYGETVRIVLHVNDVDSSDAEQDGEAMVEGKLWSDNSNNVETNPSIAHSVDEESLYLDEIMFSKDIEIPDECTLAVLDVVRNAERPMTLQDILENVEEQYVASDEESEDQRDVLAKEVRQAIVFLCSKRLLRIED